MPLRQSGSSEDCLGGGREKMAAFIKHYYPRFHMTLGTVSTVSTTFGELGKVDSSSGECISLSIRAHLPFLSFFVYSYIDLSL